MGDAQEVWAAAQDAAEAIGLETDDRNRLRSWTASKMRDQPWRVFDRNERGFPMRRSFETALRRAARMIATGAVPD